MNRRLFFALWPPDEIRAELAAVSRSALQAAAVQAVPVTCYHLTLAFLGGGNRPAAWADQFAALAPAPVPEFELIFDCFGHWRGPRVLWIGARHCSLGLTRLVAQIRAVLDTLGVNYDDREFIPHVTLARKVMALPELEPPTPIHWPVRDFVLVESVTTAAGPDYTVVARFPAGSRHDPKHG